LLLKIKFIREGSLNQKAIKKLVRNKPALISLYITALAFFIAIAGYLITPDPSPYANEQHLEIAARKPGFKVEMLKVAENQEKPDCSIIDRWLYGCRSEYRKIPVSSWKFAGDSLIVSAYETAQTELPLVFSFWIYDIAYALPGQDNINSSSLPQTDLNGRTLERDNEKLKQIITKSHIKPQRYWLGTDRFGRDMLSQLMIGARVSLSVGFISVLISLLLGILLGALSGFFRGWVDNLIIWFINVIWSIPTLLLVIAITFALGKGFWQVFIAVGLTMWVEVARVVRGQILSIREKEFVEAAKALGYKSSRIILRHILPNTMGPVIVISAANFASAILIEAGLSFLGIGVQPPMPSWGTMIKENYAYIILDNPWLAILPGLCIMILVLAFMMIGNGLRDALDVKDTSSI
jgi:peptide/nickel transport system permease protein